jgi:hypothetical protein
VGTEILFPLQLIYVIQRSEPEPQWNGCGVLKLQLFSAEKAYAPVVGRIRYLPGIRIVTRSAVRKGINRMKCKGMREKWKNGNFFILILIFFN